MMRENLYPQSEVDRLMSTISRLTKALEGERERCAQIADGMARIGQELIAENNAYKARSGSNVDDANKFCELRVSVSEEIARYIRALTPPDMGSVRPGGGLP